MRLRTIATVGFGYVLGAKAGEKRYEDMQRTFHNIVESDVFAQLLERMKDAFGEGLRMVTGEGPRSATSDGSKEEPSDTAR